MNHDVCPLCRESKNMRKPKLLYNAPVCRRCYYKFANRRQFAYVIDWLLFNAVAFGMGMALALMFAAAQVSQNDSELVITILGWTAFPLIFFLKDGFAGHSIGKFACGVQVVDKATFRPAGFGRSFMRNLPLFIPFMPLIVAVLLQRGYRLGDGWAKTKVIWKKYANHPVFTGGLACENCQYDLTANTTGICPECGTAVPSIGASTQPAALLPLQTVR